MKFCEKKSYIPRFRISEKHVMNLLIVDVVQKVCLLNMGTADLYGSLDPFQRMPKSPRPDGSPSDYIQKVDLSNYW